MKRMIISLVVLVLVLGTAFAEPVVSPEDEQFLTELAFQLRTRGWDEEELGPLMEQARLMKWDEARAADPAVVAFALHYGTRDWESPVSEGGLVRAQLALQLAITTQQMERLGYGAQAIAQGSARGISDVVAQLRTQTMQQNEEALGVQVRSMVRSMVANEVANQQKSANRSALGSKQQVQAKQGFPGSGMGNRPVTPGGGPK